MFNLIPIPSWDGLHPIIVHFPIALLLVTPLFVFLGLFSSPKMQRFQWSAQILLLIGTVTAGIAVSTGKEAAEMVTERTPEMTAAILDHLAYAQRTFWLFLTLTLIYLLIICLPHIFISLSRRTVLLCNLLFLAVLGLGCLVLAYTGHLGGQLVHKFGIKAEMVSAVYPPSDLSFRGFQSTTPAGSFSGPV